MSTRFDAATDRVTYSASNPPDPAGGITFAGWVYVVAFPSPAAFSTIQRLHSGSGGNTCETVGFPDSSNSPWVFSASGHVAGTAATAGKWYFIAFTQSGTTADLYQGDETTPVAHTTGSVTPGIAPTGLTLGGRSASDSSEWFNGRLAHVREWAAVLTPTEVEAERLATSPAKASGLWAWWPLLTGTDLTDHSGNGHDLVAGSTATTGEADPALSSTVTGTAAAAFGGLAGAATGRRTVNAAGAVTVGALTGASAGTPRINAAAGAPLGGMTAAAAASVTVHGSAAAGLGSVAATAAGGVTVHAAASGPLGALVGTGHAPSLVTGTALALLPALDARADAMPPMDSEDGAPTGGSWYQLLDIYKEAAQLRHDELSRPPAGCPDCGEPLRSGPRGELYCAFDGSQWEAGNRRVL